jgi:hypothetical protein
MKVFKEKVVLFVGGGLTNRFRPRKGMGRNQVKGPDIVKILYQIKPKNLRI